MIPLTQTHQDKLLTLDMNTLPFYESPTLPGVKVQPLFLDIQNSVWVIHLKFAPGVIMPTHFHTGCVHMWTLKGTWHYAEYPDQPQVPGSYLYEPGGSVHQLIVPESNTEDVVTLLYQTGTNIHFDADGNYAEIMDAGVIDMLVNMLAEAQGNGPAKYIRGMGAAYTTE